MAADFIQVDGKARDAALRRVPGQGARSAVGMHQDAVFLDDREPDQYTGGIIFRTELTGAFFYVAKENAEAARGILRENGCKTLAWREGRGNQGPGRSL